MKSSPTSITLGESSLGCIALAVLYKHAANTGARLPSLRGRRGRPTRIATHYCSFVSSLISRNRQLQILRINAEMEGIIEPHCERHVLLVP
jgi:hypothetical protein